MPLITHLTFRLGLLRVASFIALGLVLITVRFVYTRFKDRLERLVFL